MLAIFQDLHMERARELHCMFRHAYSSCETRRCHYLAYALLLALHALRLRVPIMLPSLAEDGMF